MTIKEILIEQYPDSKHVNNIKFCKLLDNRFIYLEFYDGNSSFYEIKKEKLYFYKKEEVYSELDTKKWIQIFRESKLNNLLSEDK
jgi:hypothetical protein